MFSNFTKDSDEYVKQLLHPLVQEAYIAEARRRNLRLVDPRFKTRHQLIEKIRLNLSPKQRAFVDDKHLGVEARCGRQGGKTWGVQSKQAIACEETPNVICPYIAITGKAARRILFPILKDMDYKLGMDLHFNDTELIATFPNGSSIQLFGADEDRKRDSLRGSPFKVCAIDEAAFHSDYLKGFIEGVIVPSLVKYQGQILMISNPNPLCAGYFYDVDHSENDMWGKHHWNIMDNPFIPHAKDWLENLRKINKWELNNPTYLREWMGEWIKDDTILVYSKMSDGLILEDEPEYDMDYEYVSVGIDFGFYPDTTAFAIIGWSSHSPNFYLLASFEYNNLTTSDIESRLREIVDKYKPISIVGDSAGGGKQLIASLNEDFETAPKIEAADKREKRAFQEKLNDAMKLGNFKIYKYENLKFIEQAKVLCRDENGIDDERCKNNLTDACLYAFRRVKNKSWQPVKIIPTPFNHAKEYMELCRENEIKRIEKEKRKSDYDNSSVRTNEDFYA